MTAWKPTLNAFAITFTGRSERTTLPNNSLLPLAYRLADRLGYRRRRVDAEPAGHRTWK